MFPPQPVHNLLLMCQLNTLNEGGNESFVVQPEPRDLDDDVERIQRSLSERRTAEIVQHVDDESTV